MSPHGKIVIGNQKVTIPSYPISRDEEEILTWHPSCPWASNPDTQFVKPLTDALLQPNMESKKKKWTQEATPDFATEVKDAAESAPSASDDATGGEGQ